MASGQRNGPSTGCALRPSHLDAIGRLWHPLRLLKDKWSKEEHNRRNLTFPLSVGNRESKLVPNVPQTGTMARPAQTDMVKRRGPPNQEWRTFLRNHALDIAAMDLLVVPTIGFKLLYGFVIIRLDRRDLVWIGVTTNPTAEWVARQITEAFPWNGAPRYMIRDRDRILRHCSVCRWPTHHLRHLARLVNPGFLGEPFVIGPADRAVGAREEHRTARKISRSALMPVGIARPV